MIVLSTSTSLLQAFLGSSPASAIKWTTYFFDTPQIETSSDVVQPNGRFAADSNGTSDVTICPVPGALTGSTGAQNVVRNIFGIKGYNPNASAVTATVQVYDGADDIQWTGPIPAGGFVYYESSKLAGGVGWKVVNSNGAVLNSSGISGPASSTDNAVVRWDGTTGTAVQNTSATTISDTGNFVTSGTGGHAFGGAALTTSGFVIEGAFTSSASTIGNGFRVDTDLTTTATSTGAYGVYLWTGSITTGGGTDVYPTIASVRIDEPVITLGTGDTNTLSAALYVAGAATEATNNYSLYVNAGVVRLNAGTIIGSSASTNNLLDDSSTGAGTTTLYIGNASINVTSDIRVKEDIQDTKRDALAIINALRVVDFKWNDPSDKAERNRNSRGPWMGIIAQEAIEHIPWLVNAPDPKCPDCKAGKECKAHSYKHTIGQEKIGEHVEKTLDVEASLKSNDLVYREKKHDILRDIEEDKQMLWHMDYNYSPPLIFRGIQQLVERDREKDRIILQLIERIEALEKKAR